jgi:ribulose-phosphate 3-epimerase
MNQIIPAILPKNQTDLTNKTKQVAGLVTHVQVDVCDGVFVKSKTNFKNLPFLDEIEYELDLMVDQPEKDIVSFIEMQPARIVIHLETIKNFQELFLELERVRGIIEIGLSISNTTDEEVLEKYLEDCDFVQFMGIKKIGYQGQPFDESVIERVAYFHRKHPDMPISIDGAMNADTIKRLSEAGASRFVCGSSVFGDGDVQDNIEKLKSLLQ